MPNVFGDQCVLGWMFIWKVFLKRFKFVQALLGISEVKDDSDANDRNSRSRGRTKKQRLD